MRRERVVRGRDHDDIRSKVQERREARTGDGFVLDGERLGSGWIGVDTPHENVPPEPDQSVADDPDAQALAHRYPVPMHPWKSKPTRTSGAPAPTSAARVAAASSVRTSRKPPPPAPTIFPPSAPLRRASS